MEKSKTERRIFVNKTKRGFPALWEYGGGCSNTGEVQIIARYDGGTPHAIYVPGRGSLSNGDHALIVITPGMIVIRADHQREDFNITIDRIVEIKEDYAILEEINSYSKGEWNKDSFAGLQNGPIHDAIRTAIEKAKFYHCRVPMYINKPPYS